MSTPNLYSYNTTPTLKAQRTLEKRGGKTVRVSGPRQFLGDIHIKNLKIKVN